MGKKVGVSREEKELSYYRLFEQPMAPIPLEKLEILEKGPSEKPAVPFEETAGSHVFIGSITDYSLNQRT